MKITNIIYEKMKLKEPIVVSFGVIEYCETILIKINTDEGIIGYGEASTIAFVTGELIETIAEVLKKIIPNLIGNNPFDIEKIHNIMDGMIIGNSAAKAGIDIALYDIMAKRCDIPLYRFLGGMNNKIETDVTLGINKPEIMAQQAKNMVEKQGYKILKIKAGQNPLQDIEAIKAIRQAVGDSIRLRVDANQGWNVNTSIVTMKEFEKYKVEAVEQPLPWWDIDGTTLIRKSVNLGVMLDESVHTPEDAAKIVKKDAADTLNIKLMKSSGIYPAIKINNIAESNGVNCMVGCMMETLVGLTATASLAASKKNITEADIDSFLYFEDSSITGGFTIENGILTLSEKPGLGIEVNF